MKEQVGTIFPSTNDLDYVEFCFKRLINACFIAHCEKQKFQAIPAPKQCQLSLRVTYCYILFLLRG